MNEKTEKNIGIFGAILVIIGVLFLFLTCLIVYEEANYYKEQTTNFCEISRSYEELVKIFSDDYCCLEELPELKTCDYYLIEDGIV